MWLENQSHRLFTFKMQAQTGWKTFSFPCADPLKIQLRFVLRLDGSLLLVTWRLNYSNFLFISLPILRHSQVPTPADTRSQSWNNNNINLVHDADSLTSSAFLNKSVCRFIQVYSNSTATVNGEKREKRSRSAESKVNVADYSLSVSFSFIAVNGDNSINAGSSDSSQVGNQSVEKLFTHAKAFDKWQNQTDHSKVTLLIDCLVFWYTDCNWAGTELQPHFQNHLEQVFMGLKSIQSWTLDVSPALYSIYQTSNMAAEQCLGIMLCLCHHQTLNAAAVAAALINTQVSSCMPATDWCTFWFFFFSRPITNAC